MRCNLERPVCWRPWGYLAAGQVPELLCFSVVYRPPNDKMFLDLIMSPLEKAWLKTPNIVLWGVFNCDLKSISTTKCDPAAVKPLHIFDALNLQNVVQEPTRVTLAWVSGVSWEKGKDGSDKGGELKERNAWQRCFYLSLPPPHSMIRYHLVEISSCHWVVSFTCQKARLK